MKSFNLSKVSLIFLALVSLCLNVVQAVQRPILYNHPRVFVPGQGTIRAGSIDKLSPDGTRSTVVSDLDKPSGIAFDAVGNLYYGNVTSGSTIISLFKRTPDGIVMNLGEVVNTSGGSVSVSGWGFDVAVSPSGDIFYNHPRVFVPGQGTIRPGSIDKLSPEGTRSTVVSDLDRPSGIAFDAAGNLYYGNVTSGSIRISLFKRTPDGTVTNLGEVVNTSGGSVSIVGWGFDVAIGPAIIYVDADATGANNGSSWADAFNNLQSALIAAESDDEIRVAQGVYTPEDPLLLHRASNPNPADGATGVSRTADLSWTAGSDATSHDVYFGMSSPGMFQGNQSDTIFDPGTMAYSTTYYWRIDELNNGSKTTGIVWSFRTAGGGPSLPPPSPDLSVPPPSLDRTATFQLKNGVVIKGGYAGFGEPNADARDIEVYESVLSSDIGIPGDSSDNSFHVVTGTGTDETAVLDGFTITAGNANGSYPNNCGGGMVNNSSSPTLNNCTFTGNFAARDGGAMFNSLQSNPTLIGCTFRGNSSIYEGGAISNRTSSPTITNCNFIDNSSNHGGGISSWPGSPVVSDSTFSGNSAELGGAVFNYDSSSTLTNCIFNNNYAEEIGGAICNLSSIVPLAQDNSSSLGEGTNIAKSIPLFADYTFSDDSSGYESSVNTLSDSSTLADCTFTGNSAMAGGGVCYIGESNPSLDNCTFSGNSAQQIGGAFVSSQCTATLTDCTFRGNSGEYYGGAFYNESGSATIINCIFSQNTCGLYGGAINEAMSSSSLYNCLITGNTSSFYGGAMYYWYESSPQMFNCTFVDNSAPVGNAIICAVPEGYYPPPSPSVVSAVNCIFRDGGNEIVNFDNSIITVTYSDVQGGYSGAGNMTADPRFFQPEYLAPISYWKFDEGIGTTVYDSVGQHHGTAYGATRTTGQLGGALDFDGSNDYISVPHDPELNITGDITIAAWISFARAGVYEGLVTKCVGGGSRNVPYDFRTHDLSEPQLAFLRADASGYERVYSSSFIPKGEWHHVLVRVESNVPDFYIDGIITGKYVDTVFTRTPTGNTNPVMIGRRDDGLYFDGLIDDVMIFDIALSAEEIRQVYESRHYRLLPDSPCINAGDPDYIAQPGETDLDGKPRVIAGRIDMGAYEFNHKPVADAGPDQTVEAQAPWGATVTLDGSGSSDADSSPGTIDDINDFNWYRLDPCDQNAEVFLGNGEILDCNLSIGEHIILLEVIDRAGASDINEVTIIVQDTTPPDINCPPDVILECPADTTPSATGKATATDTCGAVTITHSDQWQPSCGNAGTLARTWTATDESGNSSTCVQIITVVDTTPPVITCPPNVTLECPADTSVEANGSATAGDTCGSVAIANSDLWQPGCGNTGILTRTWTATDDCGNSSSCLQTLTVVDTTPPEFEFSVTPTMLWPPDHKMVLITPSWTVSDECDASPNVSLVSIVANEGDDTIGDGQTTDDIQIGEDGSIYLRSERSGTSDERVYTITYQAIDDCGNATIRSATVSIPHDFKVLARIASRWLWAGQGRIPEDLNGDGIVNLQDFARFANNWIK